MFINQTESTQFIHSLKDAGVQISDERQLTERLAEAREWHFAFNTLLAQGKRIGISFSAPAKPNSEKLQQVFAQYRFSGQTEAAFEASLQPVTH